MCPKLSFDDFLGVFHQMGHIQNFMLYKDQLITFRNAPNFGFPEALGDTIALSVLTPRHLHKIGLMQYYVDTIEMDLNALMDVALRKIALLPFSLLIDKWRWDVFSKAIPVDQWNAHWWYYR